jgi:hypothetical protein
VTSATKTITESSRAARVGAALRTEAGLARLALGLAALHVVDDNFLQPQPGTSAADHLAGGLVQAGLFVLFAWAYPRLRPGLRGTLAVFVGLFTVVMGVGEAGYYTREQGPSGDDFTGLLAIPAGFLLVGVGLGFSFVPVSIAALAGVAGREAGLASGLINTSQQIGGALGLAILTTVSTTRTEDLTPAGQMPSLQALVDGYSLAFWVAAGFAAISLLTTLLILKRQDLATPEAAHAPAA